MNIHKQEEWNRAQREYDAKVAQAAERQPEAEWVVIPGVTGWVRRQ